MSSTARPPLPTHLKSPQGSASVHLDALRGIAAVGVCLEHLRDIYFCDYSSIVRHSPLLALIYLASGLGHQWVMVFFVLSGYLVGGSVLRAHATGRWSWNGYLFNRLTRLYIVLAPAIAIGGLWDLFGIRLFGANGIYGGHTGAHAFTFSVQTHMGVLNLLGNYAFLQGIHVPSFGSNSPLWSLTNEFWYYIAFPPLFFAFVRSSSVARRLFSLVFLAALVFFVGHQIALLGLVWLMGVAIHYLPRIPARSATARGLLAVAAMACVAATLVWCKQTRSPLSDYVLGVAV
ncbi:MAG: acyltransferase family protein, partial [Acidobacteriaceae bacterium]